MVAHDQRKPDVAGNACPPQLSRSPAGQDTAKCLLARFTPSNGGSHLDAGATCGSSLFSLVLHHAQRYSRTESRQAIAERVPQRAFHTTDHPLSVLFRRASKGFRLATTETAKSGFGLT